jgi:hypothetical protein
MVIGCAEHAVCRKRHELTFKQYDGKHIRNCNKWKEENDKYGILGSIAGACHMNQKTKSRVAYQQWSYAYSALKDCLLYSSNHFWSLGFFTSTILKTYKTLLDRLAVESRACFTPATKIITVPIKTWKFFSWFATMCGGGVESRTNS